MIQEATFICLLLVLKEHCWKVRWEEMGFWVAMAPLAPPRPRYSLSCTARKLGREALGTLPGTREWESWFLRCHKKPAGLLCSPHKRQYEWTSPHSGVFLRHCAKRRRCGHSTGDTMKSCSQWCSCWFHFPCGQCSYMSHRCACPRRWCLPQSSVAPSRSSPSPEPGASSQSVQVRLDMDAARAWCWSPSGSLQLDAGTCGLCQGRNSNGQNLGRGFWNFSLLTLTVRVPNTTTVTWVTILLLSVLYIKAHDSVRKYSTWWRLWVTSEINLTYHRVHSNIKCWKHLKGPNQRMSQRYLVSPRRGPEP